MAGRKDRLGLGSRQGSEREFAPATRSGEHLSRIKYNCIIHGMQLPANTEHRSVWVRIPSPVFASWVRDGTSREPELPSAASQLRN